LLDRPILLLDEPLANIDAQSQHIIINTLDQIRKHKTCLVISHMPVLVDRADQILTLKNGKLDIQQPKNFMHEKIAS
jgi:ABC-type bacteriocin/lantibiotic exporter with double-glycine peptidase domain